jgi:ribosomal protein S17E
MKKIVLVKRQKNEMIHKFDIEFHKIFYTLNKWIGSSETLEQLNSVYYFMQQKIDCINNELKQYWVAPYYVRSINRTLQNKLECYIDDITSNYEAVKAPIQELENKIIKEANRIRVRGFGQIFEEGD